MLEKQSNQQRFYRKAFVKMIIEVTQEDIEKGVKCRVDGCPIALAVRKHYPENYVEVATSFMSVEENDGDCLIAALPEKARKFIADFDEGLSVAPFSFEANFNDPCSKGELK